MESTAPAPADDLVIAGRRAQHLAKHGATVVGISQQASVAGLSILWVFLALASAFHLTTVIWFLVTVAGAVVAFVSWIRARGRRSLLPFTVEEPERPFQVLNKAQRRAVRRQMRGQNPVKPDTVPLVQGMHLWQRQCSRAAMPTLIGMGLGIAGLAGSTIHTLGDWGAVLLVFELAVAVFITIAGFAEAHRRDRVLATTEKLATP